MAGLRTIFSMQEQIDTSIDADGLDITQLS